MECKICNKEFRAKSHKQLLCSRDCTKENKKRISLESYYRTKGVNIPKRPRTYNSDYEKLTKNEQRKKYREKNKDKIKNRSKIYNAKSVDIRREYLLKKTFKISLSDYNSILENQNFSCKICLRKADTFKKNLSVDHCHKTEKIRGLLCDGCNRSLGVFKDSVENLERAIEYLNKSREPDFSVLTNDLNCDTIKDLEK